MWLVSPVTIWTVVTSILFGLGLYAYYTHRPLGVFEEKIKETRRLYPRVYSEGWTFEQIEPYFRDKKLLFWRKTSFRLFYNRLPLNKGYENFMYGQFLAYVWVSVVWAIMYMPVNMIVIGSLLKYHPDLIPIFTEGLRLPIVTIQIFWVIYPIIFLWIPYMYKFGNRNNFKRNVYLKRYQATAFEIDQALLEWDSRKISVNAIPTGLNVLRKRK